MVGCGSQGYVDGLGSGSWSSGIAKDKHHLQFHPYGCNVCSCPNCIERAVKRLASYGMYRWTSLHELARRAIAVDTGVVTIPKSWRSLVLADKAKFQAVVAEVYSEVFYLKRGEELFLESVVQDWGDSDLSGEAVVHCHVLLSNLIFDKRSHLVVGGLPIVGKLVSVSVLNRWRKRFLGIFNYRMRSAFPDLPNDEAENVWRGYISEELSGVVMASGQLHHALNYNYRSVVLDLVKWVAHNSVQIDDWFCSYSDRYGNLTKEGVLDDVRRRRIGELLSRSELDAATSGRSSALRYERVRGYGAASKAKVGRVLKALANVPPAVSFVYKPFSKFSKEQKHACWVHSSCFWNGESVKMSRVDAIRKHGDRLMLRANFLERNFVSELEEFDRGE